MTLVLKSDFNLDAGRRVPGRASCRLLHAARPPARTGTGLRDFGICTLKWWKWRSCVQRGAKSRWAWRPVAAMAHEEGLLSFGQEKHLDSSRLVAV